MANCKLQMAELKTANCKLPANSKLQMANCKIQKRLIENNLQITKNLLQIYPNPMTYQTEQLTIRYGLIDRKGNTTITIFNLLGRKVANIPLPDNLNEGFITWIPGENYSNRLPSGVYFFVLHSGSVKLSKKFLILH